MYINWKENLPTTDEIQDAIAREFPSFQFKRNVQAIHQLNRQNGQMEKNERIYLTVIDKPLIGVKLILFENALNLKPATPNMSFGGFLKIMLGFGSKQRKAMMKQIASFLATKFNGEAFTMHGSTLN